MLPHWVRQLFMWVRDQEELTSYYREDSSIDYAPCANCGIAIRKIHESSYWDHMKAYNDLTTEKGIDNPCKVAEPRDDYKKIWEWVVMEQRPKSNDGKLNDWQMDEDVRQEKEAYKENQKDTQEIPVITTKQKK